MESSAGGMDVLSGALDPRCEQTCLQVGVPGDSKGRFFDARSKATGGQGRVGSTRVVDLLVPADCSVSIPARSGGCLSRGKTGEGASLADSGVGVPRIIPTNRLRIDGGSGSSFQVECAFWNASSIAFRVLTLIFSGLTWVEGQLGWHFPST